MFEYLVPISSTFWIVLGCVDLMEEIHQLGKAFGFEELRAIFKFAVCSGIVRSQLTASVTIPVCCQACLP